MLFIFQNQFKCVCSEISQRGFIMKILHAAPKGLPDWRIEREAYIAKRFGHKVEFLGLGKQHEPFLDVFQSITMLRSINNRQAALDKSIRKEWADKVREIDPDIIHASDLIAAKYSSGLGIPMIYDDREYWSKQRIMYKNWPLWKRIAIRPFVNAIPKWEEDILSKHVVITVSEAIAEEHRQRCKHVFVLKNYCLKEQISNLEVNPNRTGIVYLGSDFERKRFAPHRNMEGLRDHVSFSTISGLPTELMYKELTKYRIGLLPFKTTSYAKYSGSAKTYDYLAAGLQVLMTRSIYEAHSRLPYTYPFDYYSEINEIIRNLEYIDPEEIMKHAREHYVWEAQKDDLFHSYSLAIELN